MSNVTQDGAQAQQASARNQRRTLEGKVVSAKMDKTITVQVERTFKHAKYGKYLRRRKRYHAHVPDGAVQGQAGGGPGGKLNVGDRVVIMQSRPISKLVRWRFVRVVAAAVERGIDVTTLGGVA